MRYEVGEAALYDIVRLFCNNDKLMKKNQDVKALFEDDAVKNLISDTATTDANKDEDNKTDDDDSFDDMVSVDVFLLISTILKHRVEKSEVSCIVRKSRKKNLTLVYRDANRNVLWTSSPLL
jgi:hypothetical protein